MTDKIPFAEVVGFTNNLVSYKRFNGIVRCYLSSLAVLAH